MGSDPYPSDLQDHVMCLENHRYMGVPQKIEELDQIRIPILHYVELFSIFLGGYYNLLSLWL